MFCIKASTTVWRVRRIHPKGDLQLPLPREREGELLLPPQQIKEK